MPLLNINGFINVMWRCANIHIWSDTHSLVCYSRSLRCCVTAFATSREFQQQISVSQSASPCDSGRPISELFSNVQCSAEMRHDVHERLTLRFQTGHILSDSHAFVCVCVWHTPLNPPETLVINFLMCLRSSPWAIVQFIPQKSHKQNKISFNTLF